MRWKWPFHSHFNTFQVCSNLWFQKSYICMSIIFQKYVKFRFELNVGHTLPSPDLKCIQIGLEDSNIPFVSHIVYWEQFSSPPQTCVFVYLCICLYLHLRRNVFLCGMCLVSSVIGAPPTSTSATLVLIISPQGCAVPKKSENQMFASNIFSPEVYETSSWWPWINIMLIIRNARHLDHQPGVPDQFKSIGNSLGRSGSSLVRNQSYS